MESRSLKSNESVLYYTSAIPNENQSSLIILTKAISEVLKSSFSDIKETMESGLNDLGQNQFYPYNFQAEECEQDNIVMCYATGSKEQAEINND